MNSLRLAVAGRPLQSLSESGASSACACASLRFFFPLLDARSSSISSSSSACRWPWTTVYSSSSSASPKSRRNGDPKAGRCARGGDVARLLIDELVDLELECPLPTASVTLIRPLCRDMRFLFDFRNDSSISTWIVATIGACRICEGGDDWRGSTCAIQTV